MRITGDRIKSDSISIMTTLFVEKCLFRASYSLLKRFSVAPESTFAPECWNNMNDANNEDFMEKDKDFVGLRSDDVKSLRIAIIGLPNVGKSTLVNRLINRPVCATAARIHLTRVKTDAVYSRDKTQLVFIDTPGLVSAHEFKKFGLEESFRSDAQSAMASADIVGVVQDVTNKYTRGLIHERILELLKMSRVGVPSVLIMNKVDQMKRKRELLSLVRSLTGENGWPNFSDVFMVSALTSDGIGDLRNYLLDCAKPRDWQYSSDVVSDQPAERLIERAVRAKLMDALPNEVPYRLKINIEHLSIGEDGSLSSIVAVDCPSDRISKLVLGKGGCRIKDVARDAEQELSNAFRTSVRLRVAVNFNDKK